MPLAISFLLAALAIAEPLILCSKVVYAALPTLLKLRTIGELIVTLFAASGTAITNPVVVPAIYQAGNYSIEYLVEEDILNVEGHPEYTDEEVITSLGTGKAFNLDTTGFRNLMETNWQSMRDYQIDAVMRLNEIANTDSVYGAIDNIGGILQDVCKYGYCGYENSIAIVSNPLTSVKVGLENIKNAIANVFDKNIEYGQPIDIKPDNLYGNYGYMKVENKDKSTVYMNYCINDGEQLVSFRPTETSPIIMIYNFTADSYNGNLKKVTYYRGNVTGVDTVTGYGVGFSSYLPGIPYIIGKDNNGITYYYTKWKNGELVTNISQDIIGENGNIRESIGDTGIKSGQGIDVIPQDTYESFMEDTNDNTANEEYGENAILYDNLINNNEVTVPEEEPEPIIPVQPTDFPVRPTLTPEQTVQSMKGATPGITEFFPFCIPGDIVALFGSLNVEARQAPIITWNWEIERFGIDEEITIDFSPYDTVASILRNLELILFIIGLAVATRNLIGA